MDFNHTFALISIVLIVAVFIGAYIKSIFDMK